MVTKPRALFAPAPGELDTSHLIAFLGKQRIDLQRIETMQARAANAVMRYGQPHDHMRLKYRLETVSAAAGKLRKALPALGSIEYVEFVIAIASMIPQEQFNERMRGFYDLQMTLKMLEGSAKAKRMRPGAPSAKGSFVKELSIIWVEGTGKNPGASGAGTFDNPRSHFGKFVKLCVQMMPDHNEFKSDFGGLVRRAHEQRVPPKPAYTPELLDNPLLPVGPREAGQSLDEVRLPARRAHVPELLQNPLLPVGVVKPPQKI